MPLNCPPRSWRLRIAFVLAAVLHGSAVYPAAAESLVVIAGPATGRHAALLAAMSEGARNAVAMLPTEQQGLSGGPPALEEADDGCDAARARGAAIEIAARTPHLVIGHPCPAAAIAAAPIYAAAGIPFIAVGVRHPALTDARAGPSVFRMSGRDDRQGEAAAAALIAAAPSGRIAIVQDRTAYARGVTAETTAALKARGHAADPILPIVAGRRDYDAEIARIAAARSEAVFFAGYPSEAVVLLRGLRRAGLSAVLIGSDATGTREFAEAAVAAGGDPQRVIVLSRAALLAGRGREQEPHELTQLAAAALEVWMGAVRRAGTPDTQAVVTALTNASEDTRSLGIISFDARGDARLPSYSAASLLAGQWQRPTP